ncbi:sensor histidine kinase [Streptomyces sp. NPDC004284]|uniref:sensor histidine kinase n=1 Tax=Streptomyces sp. NPDC004284 TaxID=3364695 RepID=UPI00367D00BD
MPRLEERNDEGRGGNATVGDTARWSGGLRAAPGFLRATPGILRAVPGVLRADLRPGRRDPLPRHRHLGRLAHGHIVLFCVLMGVWEKNLYEGFMQPSRGAVTLLVILQSAAPVLALSRPAAALWLSTATLTLLAALTSAVFSAMWPWSIPAIALHTLLLFLLSLRARPAASVAALGISLLTGIGAGLPHGVPGTGTFPSGAVAFTLAVVLGCALRATRVSRSRLVEQEVLTAGERARRALLEERGRIARELHDVVAHHMSVISIQAQVAPHLVPDPSPELRENLAGIRQNAVDALTELRRVLGVLRSDTGPGGPADAARHAPQPTLDRLDDLLANLRAAGLDVTTETRGTPRLLSPGTGLSAYRIVQEALSNVMRHAPGAPATVSTHYHPAGLTVRITNAAATRPADRAPAGPGGEPGHGLLGMRERAAMLGGELAAGPTPDGGWEITATLPAPAPGDVPPSRKDGS